MNQRILSNFNILFFSRFQMQHTQSIHLGMKPYECPHCPSKFGQLAHRVRHVKVTENRQQLTEQYAGGKYTFKIEAKKVIKVLNSSYLWSATFICCENIQIIG